MRGGAGGGRGPTAQKRAAHRNCHPGVSRLAGAPLTRLRQAHAKERGGGTDYGARRASGPPRRSKKNHGTGRVVPRGGSLRVEGHRVPRTAHNGRRRTEAIGREGPARGRGGIQRGGEGARQRRRRMRKTAGKGGKRIEKGRKRRRRGRREGRRREIRASEAERGELAEGSSALALKREKSGGKRAPHANGQKADREADDTNRERTKSQETESARGRRARHALPRAQAVTQPDGQIPGTRWAGELGRGCRAQRASRRCCSEREQRRPRVARGSVGRPSRAPP